MGKIQVEKFSFFGWSLSSGITISDNRAWDER